jgi:hypothetical protein
MLSSNHKLKANPLRCSYVALEATARETDKNVLVKSFAHIRAAFFDSDCWFYILASEKRKVCDASCLYYVNVF